MTTLVLEIEDSRPVEAHCANGQVHVRLADGRTVSTPLWWYPRLSGAADRQLNTIELMPMGLHWPELDEDISIASMLRGEKAPNATAP